MLSFLLKCIWRVSFMINEIFVEQIKKYNPSNIDEIKNSIKEVLQDIILSGLAKTDFFNFAAFYGGTSLRIFRKLPRFSEDLDFTLTEKNEDFNFYEYLNYAKKELDGLMIESELLNKNKKNETSVESIFFKFNLRYLFEISYPEYSNRIINNEVLSIKVELEKNFFEGGITEKKLLTYPSFVQVNTFTMETLFASKLIAVLNRKWKTRVKGRDFYDYLFYIANNTKINFTFLKNGLKKFGYLIDDKYDIADLKKDLRLRFEEIDFSNAINDVIPFVKENDRFLEAFNKDIFLGTIDLLEIA